MQVYLVGGAIRDRLLGREVRERDWVVVGATPEELTQQGYLPVGRDFPVFLHPTTKEEYALARLERKVGRGYRGFVTEHSPAVTLEDDLVRRDLTINAMAQDAAGTIVDPFGGRADLEARVLRHVSPAFGEDPVRILRVARFAARYAPLGFRVAPETLALMRTMVVNGEVNALVPERVWTELQRALGEPAPQVFISTLRDCGALAVLLPEVDALFGVPQPERWHPEVDTGLHQLLALEQAALAGASVPVRFAVLMHDLGKGVTPAADLPSHPGHEGRGAPLVEAVCARLKAPSEYRDLAVATARFHTHVHRAFELRPGTVVDVLQQCDAFRRPERFAELLAACEFDARGRTGLEARAYPQAGYFAAALRAASAVILSDAERTGLDGPAIGERIRQARTAAVAAVRAAHES